MDNQKNAPIFIHSLFRSGSTYLFSVFRKSASGYWCYQEPLNEKLTYNATKPGGFLVGVEGAHRILRHPEMDKPHCYEFNVVTEEVVRLFRKKFSYQQFFTNDSIELEELFSYFSALIEGADGRPVLQCCRTTGRVEALKEKFAGLHIFLVRNPWDQWWSYKNDHYFDSRNLFIADADHAPEFFKELRRQINVPEFGNVNPQVKEAYFANRVLDSSASYQLFYSLWCHAMLEARTRCDLTIDIDQLSSEGNYRNEVETKLSEAGVSGLDFSDCAVQKAQYGESDASFFVNLEQQVHALLEKSGCNKESLDELNRLSKERAESALGNSENASSSMRDAMRAREELIKGENRLSEMQSALFDARAKAQQAEIRIQKLEQLLQNNKP